MGWVRKWGGIPQWDFLCKIASLVGLCLPQSAKGRTDIVVMSESKGKCEKRLERSGKMKGPSTLFLFCFFPLFTHLHVLKAWNRLYFPDYMKIKSQRTWNPNETDFLESLSVRAFTRLVFIIMMYFWKVEEFSAICFEWRFIPEVYCNAYFTNESSYWHFVAVFKKQF